MIYQRLDTRKPAFSIYKYNIICSGDARLDPIVNRIRHELLIAKRRVHNAAEGKSIDFNPSMKGKTLPPSMIKYTYWAPKVLINIPNNFSIFLYSSM